MRIKYSDDKITVSFTYYSIKLLMGFLLSIFLVFYCVGVHYMINNQYHPINDFIGIVLFITSSLFMVMKWIGDMFVERY